MSCVNIIFQDDYLVAINKPSGLLVHRSNIDRHETQFAMQLVRDEIGQHVFPVHRLDKPTSGVLLFALTSDIARAVSEQFTTNQVQKTYAAIVRGFAPESSLIEHPLKVEWDKIADKRANKNKPPQPATTFVQCLASAELPVRVDRYPQTRYSLVKAIPKTGRKHQIRRHLKHIAHPIIGDAKHGKSVHNRFFQTQFNCNRLLLACTQLSLSHPVSNQTLSINAQLADDFTSVCRQLGWTNAVEALYSEINQW